MLQLFVWYVLLAVGLFGSRVASGSCDDPGNCSSLTASLSMLQTGRAVSKKDASNNNIVWSRNDCVNAMPLPFPKGQGYEVKTWYGMDYAEGIGLDQCKSLCNLIWDPDPETCSFVKYNPGPRQCWLLTRSLMDWNFCHRVNVGDWEVYMGSYSGNCGSPQGCHGDAASMSSMLLQKPDGRSLARAAIPNNAGAEEPANPEAPVSRELQPRFQKFAARHGAELSAVCKAKPMCEQCMLDPGVFAHEDLTKIVGCLLDHVTDKTMRESAVKGSSSLLQAEPGFGSQVGMGMVGGVAGNLATAGVSTGVGMVWGALADSGPAGAKITEIGQSFTCAFGMGCPDSNEDIGSLVEEHTNRVIDELGDMKEELKEDIAGVKTAVIDAKDDILREMTAMSQSFIEKIDEGFGELTDVVTEESRKVLNSVEAVFNLVGATSEAAMDLAKLHHFQDLQQTCREHEIRVKTRHSSWQMTLRQIQVVLDYASSISQSDETGSQAEFMDAKTIFDEFWTREKNSKGEILEDTNLLFNCVAGDASDNLFKRLADHMSAKPVMDERMAAMRAVIKNYLATLAQADSTYYARLMYEQFYERRTKRMSEVAVRMASVLIRRGKLFKAFWDAWYSPSIMGTCPSCIARGIKYDMGPRVRPDERDGIACQQVDKYVSVHDGIKLELRHFFAPASNYARDLGQGAPSDGSTLCQIYRVTAHPHGPHCWSWGGGRALTVWYTDHSKFLTEKSCSGSYPR